MRRRYRSGPSGYCSQRGKYEVAAEKRSPGGGGGVDEGALLEFELFREERTQDDGGGAGLFARGARDETIAEGRRADDDRIARLEAEVAGSEVGDHGVAEEIFAAHDLRKRGATRAGWRDGREDAAEERNKWGRRAGERAGDSTGGAADDLTSARRRARASASRARASASRVRALEGENRGAGRGRFYEGKSGCLPCAATSEHEPTRRTTHADGGTAFDGWAAIRRISGRSSPRVGL